MIYSFGLSGLVLEPVFATPQFQVLADPFFISPF